MTSDSPAGRKPPAPPTWAEVVSFLSDPATHGLDQPVVRVDTHVSVVLLAGPLAYKVKRPVTFPFLDFSTLEKREIACHREIAIDRPIAPAIYRRVVAITRRRDGRLEIGGDGEPVEWAVEMNRFDENATLDKVVGRRPLEAAFVEDLADAVARAQARARIRDADAWVADLASYIEQNAAAFAEFPDLFPAARIAELTAACRTRLAECHDLIEDRGRLGRIRVGHGDLHCGNIAVVDGRPQLFDAIEFDDAIATGDVLYDAGFLVMDLEAHGDRVSARRFLHRFLVETARLETLGPSLRDLEEVLLAEIDALAALPLYLAVRASLRAKIAAANARNLGGAARDVERAAARHFFDFACDVVEPVKPCLVAIGGISGAGKSTLARALADDFRPSPGALVMRSDEIRKLIAGVAGTFRLGPEHYTRAASERVYRLLVATAAAALAAGRSVITDAVSLHPEERSRFAAIAAAAEADFVGLWLDVDPDVASTRVEHRFGDVSDADETVVAFQAERGPGALDWHRIDADLNPDAVLEAARVFVPAEHRKARPEPVAAVDPDDGAEEATTGPDAGPGSGSAVAGQ